MSASYLVLHREYQEGAFLYYFFKVKLYDANYRKIVFPLYFWGSFLLTVGAIQLYRRETPKIARILDFSRYALCFHAYLLLLTHSAEITPGFTLVVRPYYVFAFILPEITPLPNFNLYEEAFMAAGFIAYYCLAIHIIVKLCNGKDKTEEAILPLSLGVPWFFLKFPWHHSIYFGIAALIFILLRNSQKILQSAREQIYGEWTAPILVFSLSLIFRLWYATYIASFGENAPGFSADGIAYFNSAMAFSERNIEKVNFWNAPFYTLYLSLFLTLFGRSP